MRFQPILIAALSLCALTFSLTPALAQSSEPAASASVESKSSCGGSCDTKSGEAPAAGKRMHKGNHGAKGRNGKGALSAVRAIKALPSLTADQSKEIDTVLGAFKEEMKPLRLQIKTLREQAKSASAGSEASPAKAQLMEIKKEFRSKAKETMQKLLAILTPEQRTQLKSMRHSASPAGQQS